MCEEGHHVGIEQFGHRVQIEATMRGRSRSATSERLTASTRSMACNRSRRSSSRLAEPEGRRQGVHDHSASATCDGPMGCSSVPSEVDDPSSSSC